METWGTIIDSHVHCGVQDRFYDQTFEDYQAAVRDTGIDAAVMFPPVMEIYDRYDPDFTDLPEWREWRTRANAYLLDLGTPSLKVIPYLFIWNDFAVDQLTPAHKGIKWHRHAGEPVYQYASGGCRRAVEEIRRRQMPVVLEEELGNTVMVIRSLAPGVRAIIPHLGALNGGFEAICERGLWEEPDVWADTALASPREIRYYLERYGHERLLFGSDFPFGDPGEELMKIRRLNLDPFIEAEVLSGNLRRLLSESNC